MGSFLYSQEKRSYVDVCSNIGAVIGAVFVASSFFERAKKHFQQEEPLLSASSPQLNLAEEITVGVTEVTSAAGVCGLIAYGAATTFDFVANKVADPLKKYAVPVVVHLTPFVKDAIKNYRNITTSVSGGLIGATCMDAALIAVEAVSREKVPETVRTLLYASAAGGGGALLCVPKQTLQAEAARLVMSLVIFGGLRQGLKAYRARRASLAAGQVDVFEDVRFLDVVQNSPWVFVPAKIAKGINTGVRRGVQEVESGLSGLFEGGSEAFFYPMLEEWPKPSYTMNAWHGRYAPSGAEGGDTMEQMPRDPDMPPLEADTDSEPSSPRAASRPVVKDAWIRLGGNMKNKNEREAYEDSKVIRVKRDLKEFMTIAKTSQFFDEKRYTSSDKVAFGAGVMVDKPIIWIRKAGDEENINGGFRFIFNDVNALYASEGKVTFTRYDEKSTENPDLDPAEVKKVALIAQEMQEGAALPEGAATGAYGKGNYFTTAEKARPLVWTEVILSQQRPGVETKLVRFV